ncbi:MULTISPECIES: HNH endonuclease [unclassified Novosphingobium]|uniref:HNH endonuclease n=1 Tax=unclassified Novosphingobium TaxID=2644732 RepID=UPI00146D02CA|nr:hypothetical protein [Novosphingobium sp. SG919]NMN89579.1 hypothetical protein [Novosphingobium sp. SG916]
MRYHTNPSTLCIFCDNALTRETAPEHILLDAFGGRMTTKRAICTVCNNRFGGSIDKAFAEQAAHLRNMFQMPSGSGKRPPGIRNVDVIGGEKLELLPDGTPQQRSKPFRVTKNDSGSFDIAISVRSLDEVARFVPDIAAQTSKSVDEIWKVLEGTEATVISRPAGVLNFQLSFGGTDPMRSIVKSCLVLLATGVGSDALKGEPFAAARAFVMNGGDEFNLARCVIDGRPMPQDVAEALAADFGPIFNLIVVKSDNSGRMVGYFVLYNLYGWEVCLAECGAPLDVNFALASNPLAPQSWSANPAAALALDFEWLAAANDEGIEEEALRRISAAMKHQFPVAQARARKRETGRIVHEVLSRHAVDGFIPDETDAKFRFSSELAHRMAHFLLGIPLEENVKVQRPDG